MVDVTDAVGLGKDVVPETVARVCFADLNRDGWPDLVVDRHRVFLNVADAKSPIGRRFSEVAPEKTHLPKPQVSTMAAFADLDNDGKLDAIFSENVMPDDKTFKDHGMRTRWQKGNGDGTFAETATPLPVPPRPTISMSLGDVNRDGRLDIFFANSYKQNYEGYPGDLLLSEGKTGWKTISLPDAGIPFDDVKDAGGRPSYGGMILSLDGKQSSILSLSYGRRWNRLWAQTSDGKWEDQAPKRGLDGDENRNGAYPDWLIEYAKTHPQFPSAPEKPFRSNGNNFDASIGDVDNDGRFDVFLSTITHAWAGDSSDRSRLVFQGADGTFKTREGYAVDRIPNPVTTTWNQGDLFAQLADMDGDGWLDLILSSGDYPDQHLRIYRQNPGKGFEEVTDAFGVSHDGSQQVSLGDVDGDGAPDLVVGQTFNRLNAQQINGRTPTMRLFVNRMAAGHHAIVLRLKGDGKGVSRDALGAVVRAELADGTQVLRQLVGVGGHAAKQMDFAVDLGIGAADSVKSVEVTWPDAKGTVQTFKNVKAGTYALTFRGKLSLRSNRR